MTVDEISDTKLSLVNKQKLKLFKFNTTVYSTDRESIIIVQKSILNFFWKYPGLVILSPKSRVRDD